MNILGKNRKTATKGHAVMEMALVAPFVFFLFAGALDFGYYVYSAVSVENAARVAALHVAASIDTASDANAAVYARIHVCNELRLLPNVGSTCTSSVVSVSVPPQPFSGIDGDPATQVSVTYTTIPLIPIPGLNPGLRGQWTFTRAVQVRL
jgi:Flp pilus assembly protein TadG